MPASFLLSWGQGTSEVAALFSGDQEKGYPYRAGFMRRQRVGSVVGGQGRGGGCPVLAGVRLGEKSDASFAVTAWRDQLWLAWTGTDLHVKVASSADGSHVTGTRRLAVVSYERVARSSPAPGVSTATVPKAVALAPALAGSGARLWLGWTDSGKGVNLLDLAHPGFPGAGAFGERSAQPPSLTPAGLGRLAVAWTGTDRHVNLLVVAEDPSGAALPSAGAKGRLDFAKSNHAPAVCGHFGRLALAWTGTDRRINLLTVAESGLGAPVRLEEASSSNAPAIASHQGRLILAWTGTDRRLNLAAVL